MKFVLNIETSQLTEYRPHLHTAEASMLGLKPGQWPSQINVASLGNGQGFFPVQSDESGVRYKQEFGCVQLQIFND